MLRITKLQNGAAIQMRFYFFNFVISQFKNTLSHFLIITFNNTYCINLNDVGKNQINKISVLIKYNFCSNVLINKILPIETECIYLKTLPLLPTR